MSEEQFRKDALEYHAQSPPGKITVVPTKPHSTQRELSLAYSPGVAYPCLEIEKDPSKAMEYTSRGNLVAVISNGTAVLGLGNIGALAGKPVMEGKGLLFKAFADIDVFDIEVDTEDIDEFDDTVKRIAPTFVCINIEYINGTAIISGAAVLNGLEVTVKKIGQVKVVVSGAGLLRFPVLSITFDSG